MILTDTQILKIMPNARNRVKIFLPLINQTLDEFEINTPERVIFFLAQIAHESGELRYTAEIASGEAYEGRKDLGNLFTGDGKRYKGRGLIQLTGRANYREAGYELELPLEDEPLLLEEPEHATRSAGWYWYTRDLNAIADTGNFEIATRRINGGLRGYDDRIMYLKRAQGVI